MKKYSLILIAFTVLVAGVFPVRAGTIFYQAIPASDSDANSGISTDNGYTSAVDGGNTKGTDRIVNGITLFALVANGDTSTADNCTLNALAGSLSNAGGSSTSVQADGVLKEVLLDMTFNNGATDNSQQEIVLDPASLEAGTTYDLRVYVCNSSGQNRQVSLAFVGDGQAAVETGFFNEDDARTSAGGFSDANQVYYIDYRYTWDGDSTPGITITQKSGGAPFVLYALTNQVVPGGEAAAGEGDAGGGDQGAGGGQGTGGGRRARRSAGGGGGQAAGGGDEGMGGGDQTAGGDETAGGGEGEGGEGGDEGLSEGMVDQGDDEVGVGSDEFYGSDSLNSNGNWVDVDQWGKAWQPTNVPSGWTPYTNGTFSNCDECGWTFESDEPWAWACYHYGRWCKVSHGCGWAWCPGKVWAGSWVSWRQGDSCGCIGWAPLPPEAGCRWGVGIGSGIDYSCGLGPDCYTFINIRDFGSSSYSGCGCIYEHSRNTTIITQTSNCTNISHTKWGTYCGGPDYKKTNEKIHQLGGKECQQVHVNRYDDPKKMGGKFSKHDGNQLGLVSPKITNQKNTKFNPKVADHIKSDKIDHGWNNVKDPKLQKDLKNHIAQEGKGKGKNKATLPTDVAQKMKAHKAGQLADKTAGGQGALQGGKGQHPGGKGKGIGTQNLATGAGGVQGAQQLGGKGQHPGKGNKAVGAQNLATGGTKKFDQHPGGINKAKLGTAGAGAGAGAGTTGAAGLNQHPGGKGKGKGQKTLGANANALGGAQTTGAGGTGAAGGKKHPGQSLKGLKGTQGGATGQAGAGSAGALNQGAGGTQGGKHKGKGQLGSQGTSGAQTLQGGTGQGQTLGGKGKGKGLQGNTGVGSATGGAGAGKTHHKQSQLQNQGAATQGTGGQTSGAATGGAGAGKTHHKQSQLQNKGVTTQGTGGQTGGAQGAGAGAGSKVHHKQTMSQGGTGGGGQAAHNQQLQQQKQQQLQQQKLQQQNQIKQQQLKQQQFKQQQGGGGGGGRKPKPTPTPRVH